MFGGMLMMFLVSSPAWTEEPKTTAVGMSGRFNQLILPGSELEIVPLDRKDPVVVRITQAYPHGTAFRYDIAYYGVEPGQFDLKKYLKRKDGSSTADLPSIPVVITPTLPPQVFFACAASTSRNLC